MLSPRQAAHFDRTKLQQPETIAPSRLGWILIVVVIGILVWLFVRGPLAAGGGQAEKRSALEILKERYARGEIGRDEFEQKKRDLES